MTAPGQEEIVRDLGKRIEYAKRSKSRELLHEAYGALKMAYNFGAISYAKFTVLQIKAVREGLNNASIWREEK